MYIYSTTKKSHTHTHRQHPSFRNSHRDGLESQQNLVVCDSLCLFESESNLDISLLVEWNQKYVNSRPFSPYLSSWEQTTVPCWTAHRRRIWAQTRHVLQWIPTVIHERFSTLPRDAYAWNTIPCLEHISRTLTAGNMGWHSFCTTAGFTIFSFSQKRMSSSSWRAEKLHTPTARTVLSGPELNAISLYVWRRMDGVHSVGTRTSSFPGISTRSALPAKLFILTFSHGRLLRWRPGPGQCMRNRSMYSKSNFLKLGNALAFSIGTLGQSLMRSHNFVCTNISSRLRVLLLMMDFTACPHPASLL